MEAKILRSRLKGKAFWELTPDEVRLATDSIMIKGAAISGCSLPTTEGFAEVISDQLSIFINEFGYSNLTLSEIILAMHMNAAGGMRYQSGDYIDIVEFSGNCFNVIYISKILEVYRNIRNNLDRRFQNEIDGY